LEDVESILKLIQIESETLTLFVAPAWKQQVFTTIANAADKKNVMKEIMQDPAMRSLGGMVPQASKQITNLIHRFPPELVAALAASPVDETAVFEVASAFLERETGLKVVIVPADESSHPKAKQALPFKPALVIE